MVSRGEELLSTEDYLGLSVDLPQSYINTQSLIKQGIKDLSMLWESQK